jgi:hypothetical protein
MIKQPLSTAFWALPHEVRRAVWRALRPGQFREAWKQRQQVERRDSLQPFDRYRCLYVRVPKAAGTSVGRSLFGSDVGSHTTLRGYSLIFSEGEFREYFKFTIVRNPWDRLFSAFSYLKGGGRNASDRRWAEANLAGIDGFETFVTDWLPRADIENSYVHLVPQYRFLRLRGDDPAVDFIGHVESINEDFETIRSQLGIAAELSHLNQSSRSRNYHQVYTNEMKAIVARAYRKDIDLLGYEFDGLRDRAAAGRAS